jgi:hypothetical protein
MTALQWIIKEAKILRKKSPKMEWKKAVAQASAIYASKHKGKSPVGKKKVVKKKTAKKVGVVKHKKVSHKKKPSEQSILNKIHTVKHDVERLDEAQHKHMMGTIKKNFKNFILYKKHIIDVIVTPSGKKMYFASVHPLAMPFSTSQLSIAKKWIDKHIAIKRIKSNK